MKFYYRDIVRYSDSVQVKGTQVNKPQTSQGLYLYFVNTVKEEWRILITQRILIWGLRVSDLQKNRLPS